MNFLRKILLIAIISFNTEIIGAVLDLPGGAMGTPGLQGPRQNKTVNGINSSCYHIIVPNTAADNARNGQVNNAARTRAMAANGNIYFPADGTQPTTKEAVEYSCANIDAYDENSPITEWYMKMFGVIPIDPAPAVYVQAGWSAPGVGAAMNAQKIISFHPNFNGNDIVTDPDLGDQISREEFFKRRFKKIASTSVGRALLYRILIEIRRHAGANGDVGNDVRQVYQGGIMLALLNAYMNSRNSARCLSIKLPDGEEESWEFACAQKTLTFDYSHISGVQSICDSTNGFDYIVAHKPTIDICLFHELLHWYHFLRDPSKYRSSLDVGNNLFFSFIGYYCWRGLTGSIAANVNIGEVDEETLRQNNADIDRQKISAAAWSKSLEHEELVDTEELETILGNIVDEIKPMNLRKPEVYSEPLNGSDLSENLYRICVGIPLRFGHSDYSFYEDSLVIERIMALYNMLEKYYICNTRNRRVNHKKLNEAKHGFDYLTNSIKGIYKKGFGKCRVSRI